MAARTPGGFLSSPGFHAAIFFFFHCLKNHSTLCRFLPWYSSFYLWSLLDHYILIQRIPASSGYQASSVKLFNRLQWPPFYEESKIAKCCVAYKRIEGEVPLYTENSLYSIVSTTIVLQDIATLILSVQDLIVWLKAVDHSQLLPVNFGTA